MNIYIFGDSIAWGANDYEKGGWAERLKSHYMRNDVIYNLGVLSDNTEDLLKRIGAELAVREEADLIIFAIGINDSQYVAKKGNYRVNPDKFQANLLKLLNIARKATKGLNLPFKKRL